MGQPVRSVPAPDRIGHFDRKESEDERRRTLMRLAAGSSLSQPQT
jgi:hypothetical protein